MRIPLAIYHKNDILGISKGVQMIRSVLKDLASLASILSCIAALYAWGDALSFLPTP